MNHSQLRNLLRNVKRIGLELVINMSYVTSSSYKDDNNYKYFFILICMYVGYFSVHLII